MDDETAKLVAEKLWLRMCAQAPTSNDDTRGADWRLEALVNQGVDFLASIQRPLIQEETDY
jgi:hypothetical protein